MSGVRPPHIAVVGLGVLWTGTVRAAQPLQDAGRAWPDSVPRVLFVVTPGLSPRATDPIVEAIEAEGVDVWRLAFPIDRQSPPGMRRAIREGIEQLGTGPVGLTGHGLGGTLALQAQLEGAGAAAVGVIGAPLQSSESRLITWLAGHDSPELGLDLGSPVVQQESWQGTPALSLLVGSPLPGLLPVSATWLDELRTWTEPGWSADARTIGVPLWAGAGVVDNMASPESVRGALPPGATFERFGLPLLDDRSATHVGLLRSERVGASLGAWLHVHLRSAGPQALGQED